MTLQKTSTITLYIGKNRMHLDGDVKWLILAIELCQKYIYHPQYIYYLYIFSYSILVTTRVTDWAIINTSQEFDGKNNII